MRVGLLIISIVIGYCYIVWFIGTQLHPLPKSNEVSCWDENHQGYKEDCLRTRFKKN